MNRVPCVMVEYRPKSGTSWAPWGLEEYVVRTDQFTAECGKSMVERLTREREQVLKTLDTRIDDYRARQADAAARFLLASPHTGQAAQLTSIPGLVIELRFPAAW